MKPKIIKIAAMLLVLAGGFGACGKEKMPSDDHQDGIVPTSIEQIADVFELKCGEVKECFYDGQTFSFSITDVEDNVIQSMPTAYIPPDSAYKIRMHTCLRIGINRNTIDTKVSSRKWGPPYGYENGGIDVQQVWEELKVLDFSDFLVVFGEGTLIKVKGTSFSNYMAKAFPFACLMNEIPDKREYKFIFIITNQK